MFKKLCECIVRINNALGSMSKKKYKSSELFILLPRCLQHTTCTQNVAESINNCVECGKCPTMEIKKLSHEFNIPAHIATGSAMALELVKKYNPKCILAVACSRELVQGMAGVFPRKVYAIENEWPEGACKNTNVDIAKVRNVIEELCVG